MAGAPPTSAQSPQPGAQTPSAPSAWRGFWNAVGHFDTSKMAPQMAFRNTLGVVLALATGALTGHLLEGSVIATGALNVSYSDDHGPYRQRARRMLLSSSIGALAALIGAATGGFHVLAVILAGCWAFCAGLMVAVSATAADLGTISLVVLVIFAAKPMSIEDAAGSALLLLAGGLFQTSISLSFWPVRGYEPERRALADLYRELTSLTRESISAQAAPPASANTTNVRLALAGHTRGRDIEVQRYRALLDEAERIRLSLLALHRLIRRLERSPEANEAMPVRVLLPKIEEVLSTVSAALVEDRRDGHTTASLDDIQKCADECRHRDAPPVTREAWRQVDALAGQLRAAVQIATVATPTGAAAEIEREEHDHWRVRWTGTLATLRANLTLNSAACRHALRLAVCVAIGDALGRSWNLQRSYWIPMTIAIVLKPDFTATISRGILRLAGTFTGLLVATLLFHLIPVTPGFELALLGLLMFLLRWVGPANYGAFVVVLSALIVALFSLTGVAPQEVIAARGLNTAVGGALALLAYIVWPTWERTQVAELLAHLLDAYRAYFRAVSEAYMGSQTPLESTRMAARLARSNAEASVERLNAEPRVTPKELEAVRGILAHSNRFIHAAMSLEAGLWRYSHGAPLSPAWRDFFHDVDLMLYFLASGLRHPDQPLHELPGLRARQRALVETEPETLIVLESDRFTDSLNTLQEQIERWIESRVVR